MQGRAAGPSRVLGGGIRRLGGDRGGQRELTPEDAGRTLRHRREQNLLGCRLVWLLLSDLAQRGERGHPDAPVLHHGRLRRPARRHHKVPLGGG